MWLIGVHAQALFALRFVRLVVAFAPYRLTVALERQDVRGNAIEEPAIVADDDCAAAESQEGVLQSAKRFHIEIVGRLIEQ